MVYATSKTGIDLIKEFEGCKLLAYRCPADVWTIGYGHTRTAREGLKITQERAEALLREDLLEFEKGVNQAVTVPLKQHQFDALVSFAFNVGLGNFQRSTLLRLVNAEQWEHAASQFGRWIFADQKVLPGLKRRRMSEKSLFEGKGIEV